MTNSERKLVQRLRSALETFDAALLRAVRRDLHLAVNPMARHELEDVRTMRNRAACDLRKVLSRLRYEKRRRRINVYRPSRPWIKYTKRGMQR